MWAVWAYIYISSLTGMRLAVACCRVYLLTFFEQSAWKSCLSILNRESE